MKITIDLSKSFIKSLSKKLVDEYGLKAEHLSEETVADGLKNYFDNSDFCDRLKSYFIDAIEPEELPLYCEIDDSGFDMDVNYPNP